MHHRNSKGSAVSKIFSAPIKRIIEHFLVIIVGMFNLFITTTLYIIIHTATCTNIYIITIEIINVIIITISKIFVDIIQ